MDKKSFKWFGWIAFGLLVVFAFTSLNNGASSQGDQTKPAVPTTITFLDAQTQIRDSAATIKSVTLIKSPQGTVSEAIIERTDGSRQQVVVPGEAGSERLLNVLSNSNVQHVAEEPKAASGWSSVGGTLLSIGMMILPLIFIFWLFSRMQGGGGIQRQIGQSGAKKIEPSADTKTFADVAGAEEAKRELMEIVDYLRDPSELRELGGKPPRGVLLIGEPGNGKTLVAKAVAGEAKVPFFAISGSQFVEMFVGVGASRVREFFDTARKHSPAVLFIDEIDAVGRQRGSGIGGGNDEREQTLNQLLVEMDGFTPNTSLVIMAATNRPDVLDPALLRPGRFDLQVLVDHPDVVGREEILKIHTRKKKLHPEVDLKVLATLTPGFSGAQLEGVTDQGALMANRRIRLARAELRKQGIPEPEVKKQTPMLITMADLAEGIDRVQMGPAKEGRAARMSKKDMRNTAYHEVGHAWISQVMCDLDKGGDPVTKITIVPRARALGYTQSLPKGDRYNYTRDELLARIMMAMGGRVAQEIFLNTVDTGAQNDFVQAKNIAYKMVVEFGMSELGPISVSEGGQSPFLGRQMAVGGDIGPALRDKIDLEWTKIVNECYKATHEIISRDREAFIRVSEMLLKKETLLGDEWLALYSGSECATCGDKVVEKAMENCITGDCSDTSAPVTAAEIAKHEGGAVVVQPDADGTDGGAAVTKPEADATDGAAAAGPDGDAK
ncbi:MAG: AAA family ATPase [Candidatus Melainabacteria bacterium]|nr:AAA family ATPase [Candidatus Melainabacteria bacterium]